MVIFSIFSSAETAQKMFDENIERNRLDLRAILMEVRKSEKFKEGL